MKNKIKAYLDGGTLELIKHGKNYITANLLIKGIYFLSIPIFTRLLTTSDYGILSVYLTFVSIVSILFNFGVNGSVSRYYYEETNDFGSFLFTCLLLIVIWGGFLFSVLCIFNDKLSAIINIPVELIIIGGITSLFSGFYTVLQAYLQAAKKSVLLSRTSFLFAFLILSIAILLMSLLAEQRYLGMVYSKIAVTLIFSLISIVLLKKVIIQRFLLKHVKYALLFGLPIVIHEISGLMLNSADQFMINYIIGSSETGLYSFAYKISMLFTILTLGLNQAWLPQFYEKLKTKSYGEIKITMQKYSIGITVVAVLMVLFSPLLVRIMASKQYYDSIVLIPIIIIGFMFHYLYVVYVNYVFYEKRTFFIALFTVISALINIGLNYVLLPLFGYEIAAWTTLISYLVLFVLHYVNVKFILKINNIIPLRYSALPVFIGIFLIIVYIQL